MLGIEDNVPSYRELGLRAIHIGDEAVIDVGRFSFEGRRMRKVRQSVSHTYHPEVTTEIHREGSLDAALRASLLQTAMGAPISRVPVGRRSAGDPHRDPEREKMLPFNRKRAAEEPAVQLDPAVSGAVL